LKDVPGPWLAKYTSLLLGYYTRTGKRYLYVDNLHKKYGPFVRITPTQVSCASQSAPNTVYAQGSASLAKTPFYRAFYVDGTPSLFSTQDRSGHASKRRVLAHPFAYASVKQFEGWIRKSVGKMVRKLDNRAGLGVGADIPGRAAGSVTSGSSGGVVDVLMWLNYLTFDVISDLAFGEPLGMLERETDVLIGDSDHMSNGADEKEKGVAAMIDYRGRTAAFLGLFPYLLPGSIWAPLTRWIPDGFVQRGLQGTDTLSQIAQRCVKDRLESGAAGRRGDLLDRLVDDMRAKQAGGGDEGEVNEADVVTDAMLLLTAGSDTTANSTAAILYWIYKTPSVLQRLRKEIDEALQNSQDIGLPPSEIIVKNLKYLNATIDEGLRMFATNAFGLPRVVPDGMDVSIDGKTFLPGTELSVPAYTMQRDPRIWGSDAETFRPERWIEAEGKGGKLTEMRRNLMTFGMGPRACIGKNLAMLQMQILIATFVGRYDLALQDDELKSVEGFMHKPVDLWAGITLR
ncbi:hypothetical protein M422DRAFT_112553, partial [Sphaerobolus stellatus SS14]